MHTPQAEASCIHYTLATDIADVLMDKKMDPDVANCGASDSQFCGFDICVENGEWIVNTVCTILVYGSALKYNYKFVLLDFML